MTYSAAIKAAVDLIIEGEYAQAVDKWLDARDNDHKCSPCFYSPLKKCVRCASCLESHLGMAALQRSYPAVQHEQLVTAQKKLDDWIRAQG